MNTLVFTHVPIYTEDNLFSWNMGQATADAKISLLSGHGIEFFMRTKQLEDDSPLTQDSSELGDFALYVPGDLSIYSGPGEDEHKGQNYDFYNFNTDQSKRLLYLKRGARVYNGPLRHNKGFDDLIAGTVPRTLVEEVMQEAAVTLGLSFNPRVLTAAENQEVARLADFLQEDEWLLRGNRDDVRALTHVQEDGLTYDITLNSIPATNVMEFTAPVKNMRLYPEGYLTKEDRAFGWTSKVWRGGGISATYVSDVSIVTQEIEDRFAGGNAFYLNRPVIIDATGAKVWGEWVFPDGLNEDYTPISERLNIVFPDEFRLNATYPITIDPVFGDDSTGSASVDYGERVVGGTYTMTEDGFVGSIRWRGSNVDPTFRVFMYDDAQGLGAVALRAEGETLTGIITGLKNHALIPSNQAAGAPLIGPADYTICINGDSSNQKIQADISGGASVFNNDTLLVTDILPDPITMDSPAGVFRYAIRVSYTVMLDPTVTSITPNEGDCDGGTSVTIVGTLFFNGLTVTFGGVSATEIVVVDRETITCNVPSGSGTVDVVITIPGFSGAYSVTVGDGFTCLGGRRVIKFGW